MKKIYTIYDSELQVFNDCFSIAESLSERYFSELANDVKSPYYGHLDSFIVYELGDFDEVTGTIIDKPEKTFFLSNFKDEKRVEYQWLVQTLNYLPVGYFKMPAEMQKEVQEKIENAVKVYVEKYADLDKLSKQLVKDEKDVKEVKDEKDVKEVKEVVDKADE